MDPLDYMWAILTYSGVMVLLIAAMTLFMSIIKVFGEKRSAIIIGLIGIIWTVIWQTWTNLPLEFYLRFRSYFYLLLLMFLLAFIVVNRKYLPPSIQNRILLVNQVGIIIMIWFWSKLVEQLEPEMRNQIFSGIGNVVIIGLLAVFIIAFILSRLTT